MLGEASPDLMRSLLQSIINTLLSADADAVVDAEWRPAHPAYRVRALARRARGRHGLMQDRSYDVRVYKTSVYKGKRGNTYRVRWKVSGDGFARTFNKAAQADAFRSELMTAARQGEAFNHATGEPASWARAKRQDLSWYDFACIYVDMKWKPASAKYRRDIARAMVAATAPLIVGKPPASDIEMRSAMNNWGFNTRRRSEASDEIAVRLRCKAIKWRYLIRMPM